MKPFEVLIATAASTKHDSFDIVLICTGSAQLYVLCMVSGMLLGSIYCLSVTVCSNVVPMYGRYSHFSHNIKYVVKDMLYEMTSLLVIIGLSCQLGSRAHK